MKTPGLYVHIPFCVAKCAYCDFFSKPSDSSCLLDDDFVSALLVELTDCKEGFGLSSWASVYIGGGTPSLLSCKQIERLLLFIQKQGLSSAAEITVEANPETLTEAFLQTLDDCGVTRLSLGIQSMNDSALQAVTRHCSAAQNEKALDMVQRVWKKQLNLDCIAGLPKQDDMHFKSSLEKMLSYKPQHLSLYTLTLEEGTPLYEAVKKGSLVFSQESADRQWLLGRELLLTAGFEQYEVSNFALKGFESFHNGLYWAQKDYVGVGPGSCGTIYDWEKKEALRFTAGEDRSLWKKFWLTKNHSSKDIPQTVRAYERLDLQTLEFEFLMMGLRTVHGVSEKIYRQRFFELEPWKGNLFERLEASSWWKKLCAEKKAEVRGSEGERIFALNREGLLLLNPLLRSL